MSRKTTALAALSFLALCTIAPAASAQVPILASSYGVKCDGTTDDTTALQNFLTASSGHYGFIDRVGICKFTSTLTLNAFGSMKVSGSGQYSTILKYFGTSTTADLIYLSQSNDIVMTDFNIQSNTVMTGGAGIHVYKSGHDHFLNISAGSQYDAQKNLWDAFVFDTTDYQRLEGFEADGQDDGIQVFGPGAGSNLGPQYDLYVENGKITGNRIGVHVAGGFDNAYFDRMTVNGNGQNVVVDNAKNATGNQEIEFGPAFLNDQATSGDDVYINDTAPTQARYCQIKIMGPVTHSNNANGIRVKSWPNCFINIGSTWIANNASNGIMIDDASAMVLISSATNITMNGGFGISSTFQNTLVRPTANLATNTSGSYNANTIAISAKAFGNITSAGTTQATAVIINRDETFVTSNSSTSGVILPNFVGSQITVTDVGPSAVIVYPPSGSRIGGLAVNAGVSVAAGAVARYFCTSSTQCYVH